MLQAHFFLVLPTFENMAVARYSFIEWNLNFSKKIAAFKNTQEACQLIDMKYYIGIRHVISDPNIQFF